jgi:hypothetical protein
MIHAIQINYADHDAEFMGRTLGKAHQFRILVSDDEKKWRLIVDKSKNTSDVPHAYIELPTPVRARYVKLENLRMPTGTFALSGLRVFGKGSGKPPGVVQRFVALRTPSHAEGNRLAGWLKWQQNPDADGYVIYFGKSPEKLYGSIMVYGKNEYYFTAMDRSDAYYFQIEAFNNNGISERTPIIKCE